METTSDDKLLMSPGMDATIFLVQIGIDYIAYFPFSTLQLFELLNTKFLFKMKEEGEGRLNLTKSKYSILKYNCSLSFGYLKQHCCMPTKRKVGM